MTGRRVDAQRAYYEAIEATNRADTAVSRQREKVKAAQRQLAFESQVLAELEAAAAQALSNENYANSYAQEVAL